ncbi:ERD21 protein, partial [Polyodon spathula]|nr:ERD21 protein [Polyodon spathula]
MKVVYIVCSYATVFLIYGKFKASYDGNHDTFRIEFLIAPSALLAFLVNHDFTPLEILWTFSIYLESVAILPQLFLVSKTGEAESITSHYLFALGSYRLLYLLNWMWRFFSQGFYDLIALLSGVLQTVLYCDFFYLYVSKGQYLSVCLSHCLCVCLSQSHCLCVSVSRSHCLCVSVSRSHCLCLSVSRSHCLCLSVSRSHCLCLSVSRSHCLSVSVCLSISFCLCLIVCLSISLSVSLNLIVWACLSFSLIVSVYLSHCLSVCLSVGLGWQGGG